MSDTTVTWLALCGFALVLVFSACVYLIVPCSWLGWMPITDLPSRCLQ